MGILLGQYVMADPKNFNGTWRNYLRVWVLIDIWNPLKEKMKWKRLWGEWVWLSFKYEWLPQFCFMYGKLDHVEKFYEILFNSLDGNIKKNTTVPYELQVDELGLEHVRNG